MNIQLDYNNMMKEYVGETGISPEEINSLNLKKVIEGVQNKVEKKYISWTNLMHTQEKVCDEIIQYVESVKDNFDAFVVLGIGGSALGPICTQQALNHPHYNELSKEKRNGFPRFYVADNIDPEKLSYLFDVIDIDKTLFNVISKSGSTSETMSQFMIIKEMLEKKLGQDAHKNIVCTTDEKGGNLIKVAKKEGYKTFFIPDGVGGRFSELSPVGLLPASFCGIDIKALLKGASNVENLCKDENVYKNPALMYAVLNYLSMKKNKNICVMMPYADSLKFVSDWFAQLWAESLGKKFDNDKKAIYTGQTPVKALGVTDQHSQLQLYQEGPNDKIITFIGVDKYKKDITIPNIYKDIDSLSFLGGITQNKLIQTEQKATEYALLKAQKSNMTITLKNVDEISMGELLYFFEMSVAYMGELLNIDAFDQPGVEESKNTTYAYFNRRGYEEKRKELENMPPKNNNYII